MFGLNIDDPTTILCAIGTTLISALIPLGPVTLAINWAWNVLIATLALDVTQFVVALLATMQCLLCDNPDAFLLATSTGAAALTRLTPMAFTIHWARCLAASAAVHHAICGFALSTAANQIFGHRERSRLDATTAAILHLTHAGIAVGGDHWGLHLDIWSFTSSPGTPRTFTRLWAARQLALASVSGRSVHIHLGLEVGPLCSAASATCRSVFLSHVVCS